MENTTSEVLTTEEAAAYLKVSTRTFETLRKAGEGPPGSKVGRQWRYRREALDRWLAEREATGPAGESSRQGKGLRADDDASSGQTAS